MCALDEPFEWTGSSSHSKSGYLSNNNFFSDPSVSNRRNKVSDPDEDDADSDDGQRQEYRQEWIDDGT